MKPLILIILALILVGNNSCNKKYLVKNEVQHLIGDYDWVYSQQAVAYSGGTSLYSYTTNNETSISYGLRISDESKLLFFRDGIHLETYKFNISPNINSMTGDSAIFYGENKKRGFPLIHSGDTIIINSFPLEGENYFLKK